jgi:hypothetical protein
MAGCIDDIAARRADKTANSLPPAQAPAPGTHPDSKVSAHLNLVFDPVVECFGSVWTCLPEHADETRTFAPIARNFHTDQPVQDVYDFNQHRRRATETTHLLSPSSTAVVDQTEQAEAACGMGLAELVPHGDPDPSADAARGLRTATCSARALVAGATIRARSQATNPLVSIGCKRALRRSQPCNRYSRALARRA